MKIETISKQTFINWDSFEFIKKLNDNHFDLLICDPPYGIGRSKACGKSKGHDRNGVKLIDKKWDDDAPSKEFFNELFRVSKNQIIFGANHFIDRLPEPRDSSCWLVWDKREGFIPERSYADGELAWTSFESPTRMFRFYWDGFLQKIKEKRFHPTQKPVSLYEWILLKYAKKGEKILDPFGGSMSSAIAFNNLGFSGTIIELDKEYYDRGIRRFKEHINQIKIEF